MFVQDPINNPLLDLEYLRSIVYPTLNSIALILVVFGILVSRFALNKRRLEALFAMIAIVISVLAYLGYFAGIFGEDIRASFVRAVIPVFILAVGINSIIDVVQNRQVIKERFLEWASTFHPRKPKH